MWNYRNRKKLTSHIHKIIRGKDVVIIGSGPTAQKITVIPEKTVVMCCNFSAEVVRAIDPKRKIDIYLTTTHAAREGGGIKQILTQYPLGFVIHNLKEETAYLKDLNQFTDPRDPSITQRITSKFTNKIRYEILQQKQNPMVSSGMQLVSYAILGGARSVKIIGIDTDFSVPYFNEKCYTNDKDDEIKINNHYIADSQFISFVSAKYPQVSCLSPNSPLASILPVQKNELN